MSKDLDLWQFVQDRLTHGRPVALLVVAESTGSSPGRAGFKMAVADDGELFGSVGGGVMEVAIVERAKEIISAPLETADESGKVEIIEQVHQRDAVNASGMICSGRQAVILKLLRPDVAPVIEEIIDKHASGAPAYVSITPDGLRLKRVETGTRSGGILFENRDENQFVYRELLGNENRLYIVGGGHCALALSELVSRMDFHVSIFDDRPELNTIAKNRFADEISIIDSYERVGELIPQGDNIYVAVMTLGYGTDGIVIRQLIDKELKYLGVLGSKAKMSALLKQLRADGLSPERIGRIHTPIGIPINSRTPEEIAVSIAAEMIAVKNG